MLNANPVFDNSLSSPAGTLRAASALGCGGAFVAVFVLAGVREDIQTRMGERTKTKINSIKCLQRF
jgi:hypothetical protein